MAAVVATSTTAAATASNMPRHVCIAAAAVKGGVEAVGVGAVSARPLLFWVLFFFDACCYHCCHCALRYGQIHRLQQIQR